MSKLQDFVIEVNTSAHRMKEALVEFVNQHNGLIKTDTYDKLPCIFAYLLDHDCDEEEHIVLAVKTEGDRLFILPDYASEQTGDLDGWPPEEVMHAPEWVDVMSDEVSSVMTLYNLCHYIEEYV